MLKDLSCSFFSFRISTVGIKCWTRSKVAWKVPKCRHPFPSMRQPSQNMRTLFPGDTKCLGCVLADPSHCLATINILLQVTIMKSQKGYGFSVYEKNPVYMMNVIPGKTIFEFNGTLPHHIVFVVQNYQLLMQIFAMAISSWKWRGQTSGVPVDHKWWILSGKGLSTLLCGSTLPCG